MAYGSTDEIQDLRGAIAKLSANLQHERNRATAHEAAYWQQQQTIGALHARIAELQRTIGEVELALAGLDDPQWGHLAKLVAATAVGATYGLPGSEVWEADFARRRSALSCVCPQKPCPRHAALAAAVTESVDER